MRRSVLALLALVTAVSLLLSACAPAATPTPTPAPAKPTAAPAAPTAAPTAAPKPAATAPAAAPTAAPKPAAEATKPAAAATAPAKPAAPTAPAKPAAVSPVDPAKMAELYEAAKKEGEFIWAQGEDPGKLTILFDTFEKKYPGVKITTVIVTASNLSPRVITESQAKRLTFDAGNGGLTVLAPFIERGIIQRLDLTGTGADPKFLDPSGNGIFVKETLLGIMYNKNLVNEKTDLTKWEELLNPKWEGKVIVNRSGAGWEGLASIWGEEKTLSFLKDLVKNKPIAITAPQDGMLRLARGEAAIFPTSANQAIAQWTEGAPIAPAALGPWLSSPQYMFTFKDIPHPNAARLFATYLGTPEGRQGLEAAEWGNYSPCGTSPVNKMLCGVNIQLYFVDTQEKGLAVDRLRQAASKALGLAD